ncbi:gamma-glutamylcyclotransferase [Actinoplanes sp. TRM 88003]|uniref:Gamma-glutamylcyclotransferase n=1 Tax=Paractinoplanes aksuensis TaxID=2939490 RepID=A0ABT1DX59_9ACTN|nr:gamma-glutamylcyclotransferase family protein [Actinoplanes aksuensis]MCO8275143.1 gamma-glutamylcyclotransferase [Actinoplanes aksuensis]
MALIFGYGSLVAPGTISALGGRDPVRARLPGWSRSWNVCTDNTANGPVVYEEVVDGSRPPIQVLFLTIEPVSLSSAAGSEPAAAPAGVEGVLFGLPDDGLPALDAREGNYTRIPVFGTAWTYTARPESAERARRGIAAGTARIRRDYVDIVTEAFGAHEGIPGLEPLPAPVVPLVRRLR